MVVLQVFQWAVEQGQTSPLITSLTFSSNYLNNKNQTKVNSIDHSAVALSRSRSSSGPAIDLAGRASG